jgi:molybdopterin converting factor subunit 1
MNPQTIKVKVLFFGAAADIAAAREVEMDFEPETIAKTAFENIIKNYPGLGNGFKNSLLIAVNQEYANGDEILRDGDEIAFIPPVSGG